MPGLLKDRTFTLQSFLLEKSYFLLIFTNILLKFIDSFFLSLYNAPMGIYVLTFDPEDPAFSLSYFQSIMKKSAENKTKENR
jgi:hypothetical protein